MLSMKYSSVFIAISVILLSNGVDSVIEDHDNPDCIIDNSKPADEDGNYVDCNTPESLAENKTRCCHIEGSKGCCTNETSSDKMIIIGSSIASVTVCIMTACFIVFWCNPDTIPCLQRCPCKFCKRGTDEFTEMTNLSDDIQKVGLANQQYLRNQENDEFAPTERYDMPDELKAKVEDDWWGSPSGPAQF